jgi:hypothetical protein
MSQTIARPPTSSSPQIVTPNGTPPTMLPAQSSSFEARLHQLFSHFDSGTHAICRDPRETVEEQGHLYFKRGSPWVAVLVLRARSECLSVSDVFLAASNEVPPRRSSISFLSALSLTRPSSSASTPAQTPLSSSFPQQLGMTTPDAVPAHNVPRSNSLSATELPQVGTKPSQPAAPAMARAQTTGAVKGFDVAQRHFDPSREPKLLGLL